MQMEIVRGQTIPPPDHSTEIKPREWWRNACRRLYFLATQVLSTAWTEKFHNFGVLQKHLCNFLQNKRSSKKLISVFRGSFKTTVLLAFCIFLFAWGIVEGKPVSICYNTSTKENAAIFSEDFRQTIIGCKRLHWIFPELPSDPKQFRRWTQRFIEFGAVKFHVASLETRQVMRHYTVIINDDLVNDDNAFSETERKTVIRKWQLQQAILTKYRKFKIGLQIDTGTPYHHKDLMSKLIKEIRAYDKFVVPYALPDKTGIVDIKRKTGILTMPHMYCWEDFQENRDTMGPSLFATQYELKIVDDVDKLCYDYWLRYWSELPKSYQRLLVVDPGGLDKKDEPDPSTGIFIGDVDPAGYIYTLFAEEVNVSPYELIKLMERLKQQYDPDELYMEQEKYSITIADTLEHLQSSLNFSFVSPYGRDKISRIMRIKQYLETGRFLLGRGMITLEDRLLNFPDCPKHLLDAVAFFIDKMNPPKRGLQRTAEQERLTDFEEEMNRISRFMTKKEEARYYDSIF